MEHIIESDNTPSPLIGEGGKKFRRASIIISERVLTLGSDAFDWNYLTLDGLCLK